MGRKPYMGNQAIAFGALKAGVNLVCGYPGTPSTEILETMAAELRARRLNHVHVEWSVNEKVALEVAAGAAFAGARALVTMKQVGLNVALDPLMTLAYLGIKGGLVLVVADDPGPISSQTEQDTRQAAAFAKVPIFDPSTPEEAHAMVQSAFELSERYKTPVIVRPTTRVCHGFASMNAVTVEGLSAMDENGAGFERSPDWVIFPNRAYRGHLEIWDKLPKIAAEFNTSSYNSWQNTHATAPSHLGIVASGISYAYLHDAIAGLPHIGAIRLLKIGTPHPFPSELALEFLSGLSEVLVLEELEPVIERELLQLAGKHKLKVKVLGKLTGDASLAGENSIDIISKQVKKFCDLDFFDRGFDDFGGRALSGRDRSGGKTLPASVLAAPSLPARPPVLCAGCPHRAAFFAVKTALKGRPAVFSGDIGCYTLGNAQPLNMVDTCVCMGAGLSVPQGLAWAEPSVLHLGFVGDSTFFASGLTAVANAVYNRAKVTFCILDNSTTAMTGFQPHPGTGERMAVDACAPESAEQLASNADATRVDAGPSEPDSEQEGNQTSDQASDRELEGEPDRDCSLDRVRERDRERAIKIPEVLRALGVDYTAVVDPLDQPAARAAVLKAVQVNGVSAVVFRSPCTKIVGAGTAASIDAALCTNCKLCVRQLGCPALVEQGNQVAIEQSECSGCNLCVSLCSFGAILAGAPHKFHSNQDPPTGAIPASQASDQQGGEQNS